MYVFVFLRVHTEHSSVVKKPRKHSSVNDVCMINIGDCEHWSQSLWLPHDLALTFQLFSQADERFKDQSSNYRLFVLPFVLSMDTLDLKCMMMFSPKPIWQPGLAGHMPLVSVTFLLILWCQSFLEGKREYHSSKKNSFVLSDGKSCN